MKTTTLEYGDSSKEYFGNDKYQHINYNAAAADDIQLHGKRVGIGYSIRNKPTYIM